MTARLHTLDEAREAFARREWRAALSAYASASDRGPVNLDDIERHAMAAYLVGEEASSHELLARGYRESLALKDVTRAVRFAFWLGHGLLFTEQRGQSAGWFARARALLVERGVDCAEWGFVLIAEGLEQMGGGDATAAARTFTDALAIGRRFADPDVLVAAGHGRGRALIRLGQVSEGLRSLDELIVAVATREVSPLLVGLAYCGALEACWEVFDLRRAREWTAELTRWCDGQPDLLPYRGQCLIHRVELMRMRGDWHDALEEARRAGEWLARVRPDAPANAFYEIGELHRLRGAFAEAESAYRQASRLGRAVEPGVTLLWLARGDAEAAAAAIRRAVEEARTDRARRCELLAAQVEILLAVGDRTGARSAASELAQLAATLDSPLLRARATQADGAVLVAEGEPRAALGPLRRSWMTWQDLEAPYEAARVRALIGAACRAMGDNESADMEIDAARWVFERLGAADDLARVGTGSTAAVPTAASVLTRREVEVLTLIAGGETNKSIAANLVISEHTVARHVQNMLQKLGFSSRSSLAAFAVEHGLLRRRPTQN